MGYNDNGIMVNEECDQCFSDDSETISYSYDPDSEFYGAIEGMKVDVKNGDVYVDGEFASQLCWTPRQIGEAIAWYITYKYGEDMEYL